VPAAHRPRRPARAATSRRAPGRPASARPFVYNVRVADVMTPRPVLVGPDASLYDALVLMRTHRISGLPVTDASRRVLGVVSEKDLARVILGAIGVPELRGVLDTLMLEPIAQPDRAFATMRATLETARVRSAMTSPAKVVAPDAALESAAEAMRDDAIRRLPVVRGGCLVGIVTRTDLVRAMLSVPARPSAVRPP